MLIKNIFTNSFKSDKIKRKLKKVFVYKGLFCLLAQEVSPSVQHRRQTSAQLRTTLTTCINVHL